MIYAGVDLGGWYGEKTRIAILEKRAKLSLLALVPEASEREYERRNARLMDYILGYGPSLIAFDAPFAIPTPLTGGEEPFYPLETSTQHELQNPWLYDNSARFVYEKSALKVMAPAGESIGKLTARMLHLQKEFPEVDFVRTPCLDPEKLQAIEVYPKATLSQLLTERVPAYKGAKFGAVKARMISLIEGYFEDETALYDLIRTDDDFDAVVAALSGYLVKESGFVKPESEDMAKFTNSFIFIPKTDPVKGA